MARAVKTIIMMVVVAFLGLPAFAPTAEHEPAAADHQRAAADHPAAAGIGTAVLPPRLLAPVAGSEGAGAGDCYRSPSPVTWPAARFADRQRSRRGPVGMVTGALSALVRTFPVSAAGCSEAASAGRAGTTRMVDLRALSDPQVLRVIRS